MIQRVTALRRIAGIAKTSTTATSAIHIQSMGVIPDQVEEWEAALSVYYFIVT
jgi:hypothetical protein